MAHQISVHWINRNLITVLVSAMRKFRHIQERMQVRESGSHGITSDILSKPSPYKTVDELRAELRAEYKRKPLKYGCADFPPFLSVNGAIEGPMKTLMIQIATDLETSAKAVKTTWEKFYEDFKAKKFDTMAVPIISTSTRKSNIVDYTILSSGSLIYDHSNGVVANQVAQYKERFREIVWEGEHLSEKDYIFIENITQGPITIKTAQLLSNLALATDGLIAFEGFLEYDILNNLGVDVKSPPNNGDMIERSAEAIKKGYVVAVDFRTAHLVADLIKDTDNVAVGIEKLFAAPLRVFAGFPFHGRITLDLNLMQYFKLHCDNEGGLISSFIEKNRDNIESKEHGIITLTHKNRKRSWMTGTSPCVLFPSSSDVFIENIYDAEDYGKFSVDYSLSESFAQTILSQDLIGEVSSSVPPIVAENQIITVSDHEKTLESEVATITKEDPLNSISLGVASAIIAVVLMIALVIYSFVFSKSFITSLFAWLCLAPILYEMSIIIKELLVGKK